MSPHWNWDFEDQQAARLPHSPGEEDPAIARGRRIRRRRLAAGAVALVLALVVIVAASSGSSHHAIPTSARSATVSVAKPHVPPAQSTQSRDQAVASVFAYTPFVKEGGARGRDIALTFDDGPGPYTPGVLSVLERLHVQATFFEIGKMLRYFSDSTVRELRDGDVIGDHTESHPAMALLPAHEQFEELFEQIARIELLGGPRPVLFRPPYGSFDATTFRELARLHLLMVLWSVDTEDYLQPGVPVIVQRALAGAHPGAIILLHDAGGTRTQTIAALPKIIHALRARGFHLVTIPQLLRDDPPPHGLPLPTSLSGD